MLKTFRSELVRLARSAGNPGLDEFANRLIQAGQYTEASEDEIEEFLELSDAAEEAT